MIFLYKNLRKNHTHKIINYILNLKKKTNKKNQLLLTSKQKFIHSVQKKLFFNIKHRHLHLYHSIKTTHKHKSIDFFFISPQYTCLICYDSIFFVHIITCSPIAPVCFAWSYVFSTFFCVCLFWFCFE